MIHPARAIANPSAEPASAPYGLARAAVMSPQGFEAAMREVSSWPGYAPTPLLSLEVLARHLGIGALHYKDERGRFGLGSFKALGGAYAVANVLRGKVMRARGLSGVTSSELLSGVYRDIIGGATVTCATDGNHGRSVAWGAQLFGCRCVIYVHETVSQGRRDAIARYGAQVLEVKGNYDDAVRYAATTAAAEGWTVVSDTSYPGYRDIPLDVMHGYGVMAGEIEHQLQGAPIPTHVIVQAGVGAMAAAICASFWMHWGQDRPRFVVVEPVLADCIYRSVEQGQRVIVHGSLETVMAGLACGEVSELAWEILRGGVNACVAVDDAYALDAMRRLARPAPGDPPVVAGETGGAGLAALLAAMDHPDIRRTLALDVNSRVIYREIVGTDAAEVLG